MLQRLIFSLCLALTAMPNFLLGEEIVCRYCQAYQNRLRPRGVELQGRYQFAPDRQVDVKHIQIDVTPDFDNRTISATTKITASPLSKSLKLLKLDAVNLKIQKVTCDRYTVEDIVSTRDDLKVLFSNEIPVGQEFTIAIEYTTQPEAGLYFRTTAMGYPEGDTHIWTQGEAHEARHWFPCFDYPNERSTSEIICHVPKAMTVLSNGKKLEERDESPERKSVRWLQDIPHASYLICLVAGKFKKWDKQHGSVPLSFYSQPSLAEHAENSFEDTAMIMDFYEKEIGVSYPWAKYDQVTILDFTSGGMENTTLTTLTSNTVYSKQSENIGSSLNLDAHELAHQWFGDYVTCKDWSHLWLNEGFATYYAILYEGHKYGRDTMLYRLYQDADGRILDRNDDKRPVVFNQYKDALEQFDYRVYPKGSWILHMLRSQLGPELYRECIREYLQRHALLSVVTDDLRQIIEEKSGRSMDRFFNQWLYHSGSPQLQIKYEWEPESKLAKISIKQTQEVNDSTVLFELPTKMRFVVNSEKIDKPITITKASEDFYFRLDAQPTVVRFDPELTILAKVDFDKSDTLSLADLKNTDDMIGRLIACQRLAERRTIDSTKALGDALNNDPFYGVRQSAAWALGKMSSPEARQVLRESWRDQSDARVRKSVVDHMLRQFDPSTSVLVDEVLATEKNPSILFETIPALGFYNTPEHHQKLVEYLNTPVFDDLYALAAIQGIERTGDPKLVKPLQEALQKHSKSWMTHTTEMALRALGKLGSGLQGKNEAREAIAAYLNSPRERIMEGAIQGLGELKDPLAVALLSPLTNSTNLDVQSRAKSAMNRIQNTTPITPEELTKLREELQKLRDDAKSMQEKVEALQKKKDAAKDASS